MMPVAKEDEEKTALSVPRGEFEFNVTPFGLCNAGASYQRMMDITLSGLPSDRVLAYMDDIVIFSGNFQEHLHNLEQVFQRLQSSGISLKLSKCAFACDKVDYLIMSHSIPTLTIPPGHPWAFAQKKFPAPGHLTVNLFPAPGHLTVNFFPAPGHLTVNFFPAPGHLCTKILLTPGIPGGEGQGKN